MALYDPKSPCADEFINHQEIVDTLAYAEAHKDSLAERAKDVTEASRAMEAEQRPVPDAQAR